MTQEDKKLLLKDLSARLPYNVYVYFKTRYRCNAITDALDGAIYTYIEAHLLEDDGENEIDIIKPYLRPMSSMTEEEREELFQTWKLGKDRGLDSIAKLLKDTFNKAINENDFLKLCTSFENWIDVMTWLNAHHFDYRGLIEKGLALEAPEGMYSIKER